MHSAQHGHCRSNTLLVSKDIASPAFFFPVPLFKPLLMRLNSPHPPGSSLPAAHTRNLSKHLFNSLQRHERSSRTNTSSSPLLSASPADHRESNCIATVQLQRHTTELSLYIFLFHPNHSSGNKRQPSCQIPSPPMLPRHCESCHLHQALSRVHPR